VEYFETKFLEKFKAIWVVLGNYSSKNYMNVDMNIGKTSTKGIIGPLKLISPS
jgi:hypothetical protein